MSNTKKRLIILLFLRLCHVSKFLLFISLLTHSHSYPHRPTVIALIHPPTPSSDTLIIATTSKTTSPICFTHHSNPHITLILNWYFCKFSFCEASKREYRKEIHIINDHRACILFPFWQTLSIMAHLLIRLQEALVINNKSDLE